MPFALSLLIACYVLMRVIQIPIEASAVKGKASWLALISLIFGVVILFLTLDLLLS